ARLFLRRLLSRPPRSPPFPYTTLFRSRYPRTLDADLEVCAAEGVDVVFAPSVEEMYPGGFSHESVHDGVTVAPGALATILDGERSEEHTSELQSRFDLVCRLLLEKKKI